MMVKLFMNLKCLEYNLTFARIKTHSIQKIYSYFRLENEFFTFITQARQMFSNEKRHFNLEMEEIHDKHGHSFIKCKIFVSNLDSANPRKTVFDIMVSSLNNKNKLKSLFVLENDAELMGILVKVPSRKIIVDVINMNVQLDVDDYQLLRN